MLVLSRKERQTIRLGHQKIEVTILEICGGKVRIGIQAPPDVPILRGELCGESLFEALPVGVVCMPR